MNKKTRAYLRAYLGALLCLFFINMLFWLPCVIAGPSVGKIFGASPEAGMGWLHGIINIIVGFFVFRAVIRTDLIPNLKKISDDATKEKTTEQKFEHVP